MKIIYTLIVAASTMLALGGCTKDIAAPNTPSEPIKLRTITASAMEQQDDSRTSLNNTDVLWSAGDKIQVMAASDPTAEGNSATYTLKGEAGRKYAFFEGAQLATPGVQWATYPASEYKTADAASKSMTINIPSTQIYTKGSFGEGANPMIAISDQDGDNFEFRNLCGAIRLKIKAAKVATTPVTIDKITFVSVYFNINGVCTINMADAERGAPTMTNNQAGAATSIYLTEINQTLGDEASEFTMTLPVGTYPAGVMFSILTSDGEIMTKVTTKQFTITRSQVTPLAAFEFVASNKHFPDQTFREYLESRHGLVLSNKGTELEDIDPTNSTNIEKFESLKNMYCTYANFTNMKGLEYFTKLTELHCSGNNSLLLLDVSKLTELVDLYCYETPISKLDLSANTKLKKLSCYGSKLTHLIMPTSYNASKIECYNNHLTTLDLSANERTVTQYELRIGNQKDAITGEPITITAKVTAAQKAQELIEPGSNNARVTFITE